LAYIAAYGRLLAGRNFVTPDGLGSLEYGAAVLGTKVIMVLAIVRLWVLRLPLAYLLAHLSSAGPLSIWYAMFVSNSLTALAGFIYYRRGAWLGALKSRGL